MLRVGLTGGLGSGKSTVAAMLREDGLHILEADAIAREMMQPGQAVFRHIVEAFGPSVVRPDGTLNRPRLASLAFGEGRLSELNQIVHPPVIAEQERRMNAVFARDPRAIVVVESALIFEAEDWGTVPNWRLRFDRILLVTAPEDLRIERFLARILPPHAKPEERASAERDTRSRLAAQLPDSAKISRCDAIIDNSGTLDATRLQVDRIVAELRAATDPERPGHYNKND
ncbi:MAG TPA: dephospho-CoA kinase [Acidobacteriaceae bacterium]|jgi:dephospho-CoA kinase|nr:dephospho-CoA kinase [Acidobacteriaceae bacterium]